MIAYMSGANLITLGYLTARTQINSFMIKHLKGEIAKICKWIERQEQK